MIRLSIFAILSSAILLNNAVDCFKISGGEEVNAIAAKNSTQFLRENPNAVELLPSVIQNLDTGCKLTYTFGKRVHGIQN